MQHKSTTFPKLQGSAGTQGTDYQIKLLQFFLLQGYHNNSEFLLSSENLLGGAFDDVVYEAERTILVQAKHKEKSTVNPNQLFTHDRKGEFSIHKYLKDFPKVVENFNNIQNVLICTNAKFNFDGINYYLNKEIGSVNVGYLKEVGSPCLISSIKNNICYKFNCDLEDMVLYVSRIAPNMQKSLIQLFLDKLLLVSVTDEDLDDRIKCLIKEMDIIDENIPLKLVYNTFFDKMKMWYQSPKGKYLGKCNAVEYISQIRSLKYILGKIRNLSLMDDCKEKLRYNYEKYFNKNIILWKIQSKATYDLYELKIFQLLINNLHVELKTEDNEKLIDKILFAEPHSPLHITKCIIDAFKMPNYVYLVIPLFHDEYNDIKSELNEVMEILKVKSYKKIICVSDLDKNFEHFFPNIKPVEISIKFSDFPLNIQKNLLQKEVVYQGNKMDLKTVIGESNYDDIFDELTLLKLLGESDDLVINNQHKSCNEIPFYVNRSFLQVEKHNYSKHFKATTESIEIRRNYSSLTEEEFCSKITNPSKSKFFVIFDSPGMGKSTILNQLYQLLTKTEYWIIKINLNEKTNILYNLSKKRRTFICFPEFINLFNCGPQNNLENNIFNLPNKVILLLDALDEVCPEYSDLILNSLNFIASNVNIKTIVLSSRPHVFKILNDKNVDCNIYSLKPFSKEESIEFLTKFWSNELDAEADYEKIKKFATNINNTLDNKAGWGKIKTLIGMPLQSKMIGEIFTKDCSEYLLNKHNEINLPDTFNIKWLYDEFIERKRDIYIEEKCNAAGNVSAMEALERTFNDALSDHKKAALALEFPEEQHCFFDILGEVKNLEEKSLLKMGIFIKSDGQMRFVHKTFSEYFATQYICELILENRVSPEFLKYLINSEFLYENIFMYQILVNQKIPGDFVLQFIHLIYQENRQDLILGQVELIMLFIPKIGYQVLANCKCSESLEFLHISVGHDHTEQFMELLNRVEDFTEQPSGKITPFHLACKYNSKEVVDLLIKKKHPVDVRDKDGRTPLHYASEAGQNNIIEFLLKMGACVDITNNDGCTPLHSAASEGQTDTIELLLNNGHPIDVIDKAGRTPLHYAAQLNQVYTIQSLIDKGHIVDPQDKAGRTPLHYAARWAQASTIAVLIDRGHPVEVYCKDGSTPLHYAAKGGQIINIKLLLYKGHSIDTSDKNGRTPLHYASQLIYPNTIDYLLSHGHPIKVADKDGLTPLHYAVKMGLANIAEVLLIRGHPVGVKDKEGRTPLHYARQRNFDNTVDCLLHFSKRFNAYC